MAPLTRRRRKRAPAAAPPVIDPADRLTRLPDEILAQILSSLPAQQAVRTCVLARAWRDVWKLTRRLFITGGTVQLVQDFVDHLLRLRVNGLKWASLDECEIKFRIVGDEDTDRTVNRWIHTSLKLQVQKLRVLNEEPEIDGYFDISDMPLISLHLTRLELGGIRFGFQSEEDYDLNLDGCPALEHLEITNCSLSSLWKIMSPSVKRLVITGCEPNGNARRLNISAPCLVSLWLEVGSFRPPLLESMPELVEAYVKIDSYGDINCVCGDPMYCYLGMPPGYFTDTDVDSDNEEDTEYPEGCVLLEGLAQAKQLVLLAHHSRYIFRRDLRMCPTFSNLKTLVLNGYWCEPDCRPLACILEHAPVLENLSVVFSEEVDLEYDIVLEGSHDATAKSTLTTQCLKTVKVKCHTDTVHEGVVDVVKFLITLNIRFQIQVKEGST